ncbi:Uncharacterised protein [Niallia circulans]|uniref:hypothetical protein n=1 Tax=Niallia circulans TaxID=1397 RepID=UPI000A8927EE|nr:hypothetical protein [Niallia circulans]MED3841726.1 hypothetical protein [Niallia circulans]MED4246084.1 hypothetical protein [Niallia circulans]MED4250957.1 hypothetical protein [Niallia circulans]QKH59761.1 hypothetical protein FOC77_03340 [Niallia circulans]SPT83418.1 Uncharacterised protein [Niallia circulans]
MNQKNILGLIPFRKYKDDDKNFNRKKREKIIMVFWEKAIEVGDEYSKYPIDCCKIRL